MTATVPDAATFEQIADAQDMCAAGDAFARFHVSITCGCEMPMCASHARRIQAAVKVMRRGLDLHLKCVAHHVDPLGPDDFTIHKI